MLARLAPAEIADRRRRGNALLLEHAHTEGVLRVRVLSTFNVDLLPPFLAEALARAEQPLAEIATGAFGQIAQELLSPDSELYRSAPDTLVLALAVEDLLEPLFTAAPSQLSREGVARLVDERVAELSEWLGLALERLPATTCYVALVGPLAAPLEHILAPLAWERGQEAILRLHAGVRALAGSNRRIVVVDWEWHLRGAGTAGLHDPRLWYLARMRLSPAGLAALGDLLACHIAASRGATRKVAAVDLDGVLWGGVVGESGLQGIDLGEEGLGLAFQDFQRELLRLRDMGILLVLCSKNNPADAHEVFARHPAMVLRRQHITAERINWQDKATNLRELAGELNVGLDSFVFLDDSQIEREWVRQKLPEVAVPELPADPVDRPASLRAARYFQRIELTDADRGRAIVYEAERSRRDLAARTVSFEEFLASLQQRVAIEPVTDASLARAAQLCQRTNQFNMTTRRYTAAELEAMLDDSAIELYTLSVSDRFGDSGITGLAILRFAGATGGGDPGTAEIDTFLMSCRILGRRLEDTFLAFLAERAAIRGARFLRGRFEPTAKNAQAADFYAERSFEAVGDGSFILDLVRERPHAPAQTNIRTVSNA
jgi:FkbH-like protein